MKPFREIDNVLVMDKPQVEHLGGIDLAFVPYMKGDFRSVVSGFISQVAGQQRYLFTHQGVSGAKVGPRDELLKDEYVAGDFYENTWTYVFNGHYHKRQVIGNKINIIGSPIQRDFGERGENKGFLVLDAETGVLDYIRTNAGPGFFKIESGELLIPEGFREDKDFLWYVCNKVPESMPDNIQNLRMEFKAEENYQARSDINISLPVKNQMERYIEFVNPDPELDKTKLVEMGVGKWKRAV